jgi:lipopolysaccharide export system permease protein
MSAPIGFSSQGLRGATARDFALLTPLERDRARLEFHSKLALPLANLVLVLLAAAMALRYGRSTGLALGLSVVLAGYYGAFFLGRSLAGVGALPPELGAWGANLVYFALGVRALRS